MYMSGEEACGVRGEGVRPRVGPKERTSLGTRIDSLSLSLARSLSCLVSCRAAHSSSLRARRCRWPCARWPCAGRRGAQPNRCSGGYIIFSNLCVHILTKKTLKTGVGGLAPPPQGAGAGARGAALRSRRISLVSPCPSPRRRRARACAAVLHNTPYRTPYRDVKRVPCPCEMGGDRETSAESREIERELWAHRGSGASVLYLPGLVPKQNQII